MTLATQPYLRGIKAWNSGLSLSRKHACTDYAHIALEVIRTSLALLLTTPALLDLSPSRTQFHLKFGPTNGCLLSCVHSVSNVTISRSHFFLKIDAIADVFSGCLTVFWNSTGLINSWHMAWHNPADLLLTSAHLFLAMLFAFSKRDLSVKRGGKGSGSAAWKPHDSH